jgi:hypothetical protein
LTLRSLTLLNGDGRIRELRHWTAWLSKVPAIRRKFCQWSEDFDAFHSNEAASVAVLANAAAKAGYLAHTEYVALKRHVTRGRPFRQGRCDLWIADVASSTSWAFEVKQHFAAKGIRQATFDGRLARALADAKQVDRDEADRRVGCLILAPRHGTRCDSEMVDRIDELCASADIAFRIGSGLGPVWLAFAFVD